jgi:hypothetical protein
MAILWRYQDCMASKILQWQHDSELLNNGEAACDGNAMAIWRRRGSVALMTILQWRRDGKLSRMERVTACDVDGNGKLFDNEERDCLQWRLYGDLKAAWRARYCNGNVRANSSTMERLLAMAMLWLFGGGVAVWR